MKGFGGWGGALILHAVLLVPTAGVDANTNTPSAWDVGSPTAFASIPRPTAKCNNGLFTGRRSFANDGCLSNGRSPSRRAVVLWAKPKPTEEEMEKRKEELRLLISASKKEIDKLVRNNPSVLQRLDIEKNHAPKLKLLQNRLGIDQKAAGRLCLNARRLLTFSFEALETRIDSIQSSLELGDKELTKMIVKRPELLTHNMSTENIKQRFSFLQEVLDLPEGDVTSLRKYSMRAPEILFWQEDSMKESQQWIQQRFVLGDARVAQMCRNMPHLLYANTTTLSNKAESIQTALSLDDEELSNLVSKYSTIFCFSIEEKTRPTLRYLRMRFELDEEALKNLVLKAPSLFSYSEGNIEEKLQFYSNLVGEREAKRMVVKSSNLLKQSLEKRLKPRLEEVQLSGFKVRWTETLIRRLATRTDDQWERFKLGEAKR